MGGGNAFLRFSSSVAAGALILPQVARAQECVKTYEGCGSCDNPNVRFLTVVSSSENLMGPPDRAGDLRRLLLRRALCVAS